MAKSAHRQSGTFSSFQAAETEQEIARQRNCVLRACPRAAYHLTRGDVELRARRAAAVGLLGAGCGHQRGGGDEGEEDCAHAGEASHRELKSSKEGKAGCCGGWRLYRLLFFVWSTITCWVKRGDTTWDKLPGPARLGRKPKSKFSAEEPSLGATKGKTRIYNFPFFS